MSTENFLAVEFDISVEQATALEAFTLLLRDCCRRGLAADSAVSLLQILINTMDPSKELNYWRATRWITANVKQAIAEEKT